MTCSEMPLWKENAIPFSLKNSDFIPSISFCPAERSATHAVLICPGGAYTHKARHEGAPIAQRMNLAGLSAFVLDYRISPCDFLAPLNDALRAIRMIRSLGYDRVAICGFSAGGHLACSAAVHWQDAFLSASDPIDRLSSRPDALISCYSVVSFIHYSHRGSMEALLGEHVSRPDLAEYFSSELHVTPETPPAFIWHSLGDCSVPAENSINLAAAYRQQNVPFELHLFTGGKHGTGLSYEDPAASSWTDLCVRWLKNTGF